MAYTLHYNGLIIDLTLIHFPNFKKSNKLLKLLIHLFIELIQSRLKFIREPKLKILFC